MPNDENPDYKPYTTPDTLNDLDDVVLTNITAPAMLYYHNGAWENFPAANAIAAATSTDAASINAIIAVLVAAGLVKSA